MYPKEFWADTLERVVSTAAQAAIAAIGTTALVQDLNWVIVGGTAGSAALLSLLKALAAGRRGDPGNASLLK